MYPYINHCAIIWADNNNSHRDSILLLQKRFIVRTCTNSMWLEHTNPLFQSLNTLKIQDLHSLQVGIFMNQFHHNLFPDDLLEPNYFTMNNEVHNYNTRGATNIRVGLVNTCLAYNTIRIQGALLWNTPPTSLKNAPSINVFKRSYKKSSWTIRLFYKARAPVRLTQERPKCALHHGKMSTNKCRARYEITHEHVSNDLKMWIK